MVAGQIKGKIGTTITFNPDSRTGWFFCPPFVYRNEISRLIWMMTLHSLFFCPAVLLTGRIDHRASSNACPSARSTAALIPFA
jgi:hypothetical protein